MMVAKKLNKEQLSAVKHGRGPLLIIAGAGTGKTTVITERILRLIKTGAAKPSEVLALTFTEKAAAEMQERVDVAMPYGYTEMQISTFHGFCDRVLRDEVLAIGLTTDYSLLSRAETIQFFRKNMYEFDLDYFRPVGNPTKFVEGMVTHFSRLQDENITPRDYKNWVNKQRKMDAIEKKKWQELSNAYAKYEELKAHAGFFDFGDLIVKTLDLFKKRPNILKEYQKKYKYIMVDEFQDTNYSQFELALMLAGERANITAVADDDQSIYRFRGASVSNVLQFRKKFPNSKLAVLTKNYRSNQTILDASYRLIKHNDPDRLESREGINKKLVSQRKGKSSIRFIHRKKVADEAEAVTQTIKKLADKHKLAWSDFAILVRANAHADPFISSLKYHNVPFQFLGPEKLFLQPEVVEMISYLKILTDQNDSAAMYQVLSMPEISVIPSDLIKMTTYAKRKNKTLFEVLESSHDLELEESSEVILTKLREIINSQQVNLKATSSGKILYDFLTHMDIMQKYIEPDTEERQKRTANIGLLFERIKNYEANHAGATVFEVVDWIELASEMGESPRAAEEDWTTQNAVNILTIHSSKGLEFPVVFLVNLVSLRFPSVGRHDAIPLPDGILKEILPEGDVHLEEERRLFYVGMTRARDHLFFMASDFYGETLSRPKKFSPFIFEALGEDVLKSEEENTKEQKADLASFSPTLSPSRADTHQKLHIHYLSYSQIEAFKLCPLHYKLRYILGVPTAASSALSLGSSVHKAIKAYHESLISGQKASLKNLQNFLSSNWIDDGFISRAHERQSFQKAQDMLRSFYKSEKDRPLPVLLERPFTIPLEVLGEAPLKIGGVMDRVDKTSGGIEIIDYKTGARIPTQKEVDKNLQLSLYALAAVKISEPPFVGKLENIKLTLWFLDENTKISTTRSMDQIKQVVDEVFEIRREIESSNFSCSAHPFCEFCEYKNFCRRQES